jgi:hypothetical protein
MRLVTFGRAMAPHAAGDTRLVSDSVAKRLDSEGLLSATEPYPPAAAPAAKKPTRPILKPTRPATAPDQRVAR